MRNVEDRRHNLASEAELARHNIRSEVINLYDINTKAATAKYQSDMNYAGTKYNADANLQSSIYSADSHLAGTKYSADIGFQGTKYSADTHATASMYSADRNLQGTIYSADKHYQGTVYSADSNLKGTVYSANKSYDSNVLVNTGRIEAAKISAAANRYNADLNYSTNQAKLAESRRQFNNNYIISQNDALMRADMHYANKLSTLASTFRDYTQGANNISSAFKNSMNGLESIGNIASSVFSAAGGGYGSLLW